MRIFGKVAVGALACILSVGSVAFAQSQQILVAQAPDALTVSLDAAIASGDVAAINSIIAANKNDAAATAKIAGILYASAQATSAANPTGGAILAALAVSTGGLTGSQALAAQNMVASNPTVLALVTNANAPNTGGLTSSLLQSSGTIVASNPPANNPSQTTPQSR